MLDICWEELLLLKRTASFSRGVAKTKSGWMKKLIPLNENLRYTQATCRDTFQDGRKIEAMVGGLRSGQISIFEVDPLRVVEVNSRPGGLLCFSMDNRRLHAFKSAAESVGWVPALVKPEHALTDVERAEFIWKSDTKTEGKSIVVRGKCCRTRA